VHHRRTNTIHQSLAYHDRAEGYITITITITTIIIIILRGINHA
jgi:hypothetical protein